MNEDQKDSDTSEYIQGATLSAWSDANVVRVRTTDILMLPVPTSWTPTQLKEWSEYAAAWLAAKGVTVNVMPIASHFVQVLRQDKTEEA